MHLSRTLILLLFLCLAGCQAAMPGAAPTAAPTAAPSVPSIPSFPVQINQQDVRQTLREVGGGNFIHRFGGATTALEPVSTLNLETLDPKIVRTQLDLHEWEPQPGVTGPERFQLGEHVGPAFEFLREMKRRDPDTILIASIWEVPDWMVSNPEADSARIIPPELYPQVIESIGAWLVRARDEYGAEVDYVSFNEPNIGINILFTSEEHVELIRQAGPRFAGLGLKTRWLLGDANNMSSAASYNPPIYAAEDIRPYLGPFSFHSWDAFTADHIIKELGRYSKETGLEAWCTEVGWDAQQWQTPEEFPTWNHALKLANTYTRVLRDSRATTMLYWEMTGRDYSLNDGEKPYHALRYLHLLKRHFPAGSQIVGTPDDPIQTLTILSLAAKTPQGGFSIQVLNQVKDPCQAVLDGLPNGPYTVTRLTEEGGVEVLEPVEVTGSRFVLDLPGNSIFFMALSSE